jgi:hypothetical protein
MELLVKRVDVWAASIADEPGALAARLAHLADAGADLDFVVARRSPDQPGTGVMFVTPLTGDEQIASASEIGFSVTQRLHSLRIEGDNEPGVCAKLTKALGDAGLNLRGLSAAVIGPRFIIYVALDTLEEADKAAEVLKAL